VVEDEVKGHVWQEWVCDGFEVDSTRRSKDFFITELRVTGL